MPGPLGSSAPPCQHEVRRGLLGAAGHSRRQSFGCVRLDTAKSDFPERTLVGAAAGRHGRPNRSICVRADTRSHRFRRPGCGLVRIVLRLCRHRHNGRHGSSPDAHFSPVRYRHCSRPGAPEVDLEALALLAADVDEAAGRDVRPVEVELVDRRALRTPRIGVDAEVRDAASSTSVASRRTTVRRRVSAG
jgi:hypothetical protein